MSFLYSQLFIKPTFPKVDLSGQTVIVTGSNTGLGKEAARHLASLGADKVILAVRNVEAGEAAKKDIAQSTGKKSVEVWQLDLASSSSIKAFAEKANKLARLDAVVENAGIATPNFSLSEGHERTIQVNVIGTFLLALLLLPKLKATAKEFSIKPRLTIVSSEVHGWCKFDEWKADAIFPTLDDEKNTTAFKERYQVSKLLEVLVIRHIAPQLAGSNVILNMLNPGLCHSELGRDSGLFLTVLKFFLARTTEMGSRTLVAAALAGEESHGKYMSDGVVKEQMLSSFATSQDGKKAGEKVWKELSAILEKIQPGVTSNLSK